MQMKMKVVWVWGLKFNPTNQRTDERLGSAKPELIKQPTNWLD